MRNTFLSCLLGAGIFGASIAYSIEARDSGQPEYESPSFDLKGLFFSSVIASIAINLEAFSKILEELKDSNYFELLNRAELNGLNHSLAQDIAAALSESQLIQ